MAFDLAKAASVLRVGVGQQHEAADVAAVKEAYRKIAVRTHPDKLSLRLSAKERDAEVAKFKAATQALEVIEAHVAQGGRLPIAVKSPPSKRRASKSQTPAPATPGPVSVEWKPPRNKRGLRFATIDLRQIYRGPGLYPGTVTSPAGTEQVSGQFWLWVYEGQLFANGMGVVCPVEIRSQINPVELRSGSSRRPKGESRKKQRTVSAGVPEVVLQPHATVTPVHQKQAVLDSFSTSHQGALAPRKRASARLRVRAELVIFDAYNGPGTYPGHLTVPTANPPVTTTAGQFRVWNDESGTTWAEGMGTGPVRVRITSRLSSAGSEVAPVQPTTPVAVVQTTQPANAVRREPIRGSVRPKRPRAARPRSRR